MIYIDMEGFTDPHEFIIELLNHGKPTLLRKAKNLFYSARDTTDSVQILDMIKIDLRESNHDWKEKGMEIFSELAKEHPKPIVVIDELPVYLLNMKEKHQDGGLTISAFLHWLRRIRQELEIRFIVCGSIGIDAIIDKYGLENSINDLSRLSLPPFDDKIAKGMIMTLLDRYGIAYTDELIEKIMRHIGLQVPFFIQLMLREITIRTNFGKEKLTDKIIHDSYRCGLLGSEGRKDFKWYFKRLEAEFGSDHEIVKEILEHLARVSNATEDEIELIYNKHRRDRQKFVKLLDTLETGFYIARGGGRLTFHNKVLRDLWLLECRSH